MRFAGSLSAALVVVLSSACGEPRAASVPSARLSEVPTGSPPPAAPPAPLPVTPPSVVPAPTPPAAPPAAPPVDAARPLGSGLRLPDADAARAAVFACHGDEEGECRSALWPRGILDLRASAPRGAVCDASVSPFDALPGTWVCDAALSRCVAGGADAESGEHTVYLFATTSGSGRVLTALVHYGAAPVPAIESEPVRAALAERATTCELLDAVQTDPTPHLGEAFVQVANVEQDDSTGGSGPPRAERSNTVVCGLRARGDALTAARNFSGWGAVCGRFDCYDRAQRGNGQSGLHAERDASSVLRIVASWEGYAGQTASFGGVRRALAAHPCAPTR